MILHIFNDSLFSKQFISKSYLLENQDESYYAIFTKKHLDKSSLPSASNIIDITKNQDNIKLLKYKMKEADKIVIHSMSKPLIFILWLALHPKLIQKSIPVFWGGELYDKKSIISNSIRVFKKNLSKSQKCWMHSTCRLSIF